MNFSAVILAGGKSSRMGRDKAWLEVGGQTLLARQIGLVRELGAAEVFISARADADYPAFGCRVLQDKFAGAGPLAGIERALDACTMSPLLVLAVDLPGMSVELLRRLAVGAAEGFGAIPRLAGRLEPLAAFYPKAAHALAMDCLERKNLAVIFFSEMCVRSGMAGLVELGVQEEHYFTNWNSPADLSCTT